MASVSRQQLIVERFLEDERLRGDLEDAPAKALLEWATTHAGQLAADQTRSDDEVDTAVQSVRKAAMQAAFSGETEPAKVVALAAAALEAASAPAASAAQSAAPRPATLSEQEVGKGAPTNEAHTQAEPGAPTASALSQQAAPGPATLSEPEAGKTAPTGNAQTQAEPGAPAVSNKGTTASEPVAASDDKQPAAKREHETGRKPHAQRRRNRFGKLLKQMRRGE